MRSARAYHGIVAFDPEERARSGWLTMAEAAHELGVSPMSVRRMLQAGILPGEQVVPYAPWVIRHSDLQQEAVQQEVNRIRGEGKIPLPADPNQLTIDSKPTVAR